MSSSSNMSSRMSSRSHSAMSNASNKPETGMPIVNKDSLEEDLAIQKQAESLVSG